MREYDRYGYRPYWGLILSPGSELTVSLLIGRCGNAASSSYLLLAA